MLVGSATWNSAESPYMGCSLVIPVTPLLLRGPWPLMAELGRPSFAPPAAPNPCEMEPSRASVPSWSQPVKGLLALWEVSGPSLPDSFFVVGLVVPRPVVEVLVFVGHLGAAQPVDGYALVVRGERGGGVVAGVYGRSAADYSEPRAVGPDVGVAGCGSCLGQRCCSPRWCWRMRCAW